MHFLGYFCLFLFTRTTHLFNDFWAIIKTPRQTISVEEFRTTFKHLNPSYKQYGMDVMLDNCGESKERDMFIKNISYKIW